MVCKLSFAFSRMSWLKYLFYTDIFLNTYLCMKFSMYTQSLLRRAIRSYFVTSQKLSSLLVRYTVLCFWPNGDGEIRTLDPLLARQVLSQLSYTPIWVNLIFNLPVGLNNLYSFKPMGLSGLEPPTSRLSGVRSNRLSYKPISIWQPPAFPYRHQYSIIGRFRLNHRVRDVDGCFPKAHRHQKIVSASQIH